MFINSDRELILATSGNNSQAKISRILMARISVSPNKGEKIIFQPIEDSKKVQLVFFFSSTERVEFPLNLIRYEFLVRVGGEGALPGNFSRECYEDILFLKSQLLETFRKVSPLEIAPGVLSINTFSLDDQGLPKEHALEVTL